MNGINEEDVIHSFENHRTFFEVFGFDQEHLPVDRRKLTPLGSINMIRFATPVDAERIADIHVATWRAAYRRIVPDSFLASLSVEQRADGWRSGIEANSKLVLVHEHDGRIDGWVAMGFGRDDDANTDGEIYALYVAPESWRKGIGRALMERAEEELSGRGLNRIVLWVLEQNDRARRFYESVGYSPDGRTKEITITEARLLELRYAKQR